MIRSAKQALFENTRPAPVAGFSVESRIQKAPKWAKSTNFGAVKKAKPNVQ
jgi:hypothetical protein